MARKKTGRGATESVESLKTDRFWKLEQAKGSAHIWSSIKMDWTK